jgi:hypothetical protein
MILTKEQIQEIEEFLVYQGYDITIDSILEEYEKYKNWIYI